MYSTQKMQVLNHLKEHGSISSWEAITNYHITRLSEYIRALRHEDMLNIPDEWQESNGKRFKVYRLESPVFKVEQSGQMSLA